jgi:hypothetical protein
MSVSESKSYNAPSAPVDFAKYPTSQKLLKVCQKFFDQVENLYISLLSLSPSNLTDTSPAPLGKPSKPTLTRTTVQETPSTRNSAASPARDSKKAGSPTSR